MNESPRLLNCSPLTKLPENISLGRNITIAAEVLLHNNIIIEDAVNIETRVIFLQNSDLPTIIREHVCIGPASIIGAGLEIGRGAHVEAGSVLTSSVPPNAIVQGNPASIVGYVPTTHTQLSTQTTTFSETLLDGATAPLVRDLGVGDCKIHLMRRVADARGALTVGEVPAELPFEPKRYFLVFDVPSSELRGEHAHKECHQFLICAHGSCRVLLDDGTSRCEVVLDRPELGIHMPPRVWGTQYRYSKDAVLLVFASHGYDPDDYIRNYDEFIFSVQRLSP